MNNQEADKHAVAPGGGAPLHLRAPFTVQVDYAGGEDLHVCPYSYSYSYSRDPLEETHDKWRVVHVPNEEFKWRDVSGTQFMLRDSMYDCNYWPQGFFPWRELLRWWRITVAPGVAGFIRSLRECFRPWRFRQLNWRCRCEFWAPFHYYEKQGVYPLICQDYPGFKLTVYGQLHLQLRDRDYRPFKHGILVDQFYLDPSEEYLHQRLAEAYEHPPDYPADRDYQKRIRLYLDWREREISLGREIGYLASLST